ncbi:right-handed parallel beta-helix repeat-containing protein [Parvularcula marina]|uniref:Right handed beta helix domain-containing protein n=1 Tax=Parvularcula marina TaxID=2292771 RepID=A0A371RK58_9PROT|nr:right-handed parallel beta-helix repeat-containing protein [Parvularcula marina]RFB05839.1 hypothetical protein DX908_11515 [Parvularcula marina]
MGKTADRRKVRRAFGAFTLLSCLFFTSSAAMALEIIEVTPGEGLAAAIRSSAAGDELHLAEGRYTARDIRIPHDLTIIGEGEVILSSPQPVAKGLLVSLTGVDLTVRGLRFEGAVSPDKNGAGIRFEGSDLVIEDCVFLENEDGILATGDHDGSIRIRRSSFIRNGHGDGFSHGVYQSNGAVFEVTQSRFSGTKVGHHLKILAGDITVTGNSFDDGEGRTSYVLDVPAAGKTVFSGNSILRRRSADQNTLVNFSTRRGDHGGSMEISGNSIVSEKTNLRILRNPEKLPATINGNAVSKVRRIGENEGEEGSFHLQPAPEYDMSFRLRRTDREGGFVTFGEAFEKGAVPAGAGLMLETGGDALPLQMDVKATHDDGSVRHAVLTLGVPAGRGAVEGQYRAGKAEAAAPLGWDASLFDGLTLRLDGQLGGKVTTATLDINDTLTGGEAWLTGPLAVEKTAAAPLGPLLIVRLDGRQYQDGTARLRLTFENHKTFSPLPRDLAYKVTLARGDETLSVTDVPLHYRHSGWTMLAPLGAEPAGEVIPSLTRLTRSGAVPPYTDDVTPQVREDEIGPPPYLPGTHGALTPYMPSTGGRLDIGPMTHWAAAWAIAGESEAREEMLRTADIGLTIPWHFEEDKTGLPIRLDQRPRFWAEERGAGKGRDQFPEGLMEEDRPGGWVPDTAHKPELAYPAYLATGEALYARALSHEAAFGINAIWPKKREPGPLVVNALQIRTGAWSLRSIANAAWLLPDDDPLKEYFIALRDENLAYLNQRYVTGGTMDAAGETEGWFDNYARGGPGSYAAWQSDFLAIIIAHEAIRETPNAREVLDWLAGYITGRVLNIDDVTIYAGARMMMLDDDGRYVSSWAEAERLTRRDYPDQTPYMADAKGYYSILRAALATIYTATGNPDAARALEKLRRVDRAEELFLERNKGGRIWASQFNFD